MRKVRNAIYIILSITLIIAGIAIVFEGDEVEGWQTISFPNVGTIQILLEWRCYEENDCVYIVDENDSLIMFQSYSYPENDSSGIEKSNKYIEGIQCTQSL